MMKYFDKKSYLLKKYNLYVLLSKIQGMTENNRWTWVMLAEHMFSA